jgi:hypothetical protein
MATPGNARPPTPREIAMYGHVAAALRAWIEKTGMSIGDINVKLGHPRGHTNIYHWINAKGGPGPESRKKLGKLLGVAPDDLKARKPGEASRALVVAKPDSGATSERPRPAEVLTFWVNTAGEARLKLDITLPLPAGSALLRMILDAGITMGDLRA